MGNIRTGELETVRIDLQGRPTVAQWARAEALDQARKWVTTITDKENDEIEKAFELIEMLALRWAELIETGDAE